MVGSRGYGINSSTIAKNIALISSQILQSEKRV